jgi:hypothetical protein
VQQPLRAAGELPVEAPVPIRCSHLPTRSAGDGHAAGGVEKGVEEHQDMEIFCVVGTRSWVVCAKTWCVGGGEDPL